MENASEKLRAESKRLYALANKYSDENIKDASMLVVVKGTARGLREAAEYLEGKHPLQNLMPSLTTN